MGKPFCTCPEGLKRDPNGNCGKNVEHIISNWWHLRLIIWNILKTNNDSGFFFQLKPMHRKSQTTFVQKKSVRTLFKSALYIDSIFKYHCKN